MFTIGTATADCYNYSHQNCNHSNIVSLSTKKFLMQVQRKNTVAFTSFHLQDRIYTTDIFICWYTCLYACICVFMYFYVSINIVELL